MLQNIYTLLGLTAALALITLASYVADKRRQ